MLPTEDQINEILDGLRQNGIQGWTVEGRTNPNNVAWGRIPTPHPQVIVVEKDGLANWLWVEWCCKYGCQ